MTEQEKAAFRKELERQWMDNSAGHDYDVEYKPAVPYEPLVSDFIDAQKFRP